MKRIGVDSNVVLSFLTDRNRRQQDRAAPLLAQAREGDCRVVLPQVVLLETVYVLRNLYDVELGRVRTIVRDMQQLPGVVTVDAASWHWVWTLWPERVPDFGDACIAAVAREGAFDELATFDAAFARSARRLGIPLLW